MPNKPQNRATPITNRILRQPYKINSIEIISLILLPIWPIKASAAACEFTNNNTDFTLSVNIPYSITIPRDAPNGTVLFKSTPIEINKADTEYTCYSQHDEGVVNDVGTTTPGSVLFPIGNTGISWRWIREDINKASGGYPSYSMPAGRWTWRHTSHVIELVKTGELSSDLKLPGGILGRRRAGDLYMIAVKTNGTVIVSASCETPDVIVDMGNEYKLSDFDGTNGKLKKVNFNLKLNNCPASIKNVNYTLKATTPAVDSSKGVVSLNAASNAKGIALQLFDTENNPIPLDTPQKFIGYNSAGGNFQIPMSASYYRIPSESLTPGTANAEVTFIMSYL